MGRAICTPPPPPRMRLSSDLITTLPTDKVTTVDAAPKSPAEIRPGRYDVDYLVESSTHTDYDTLPRLGMPPTTGISRSQTPPHKRMRLNWHGLPSPETPSYIDEVFGYQSADLRSDGQHSSSEELFQSDEQRRRIDLSSTADVAVSPVDTPLYASSSDTGSSLGSGRLSVLLQHSPSGSFTSNEVDAEAALDPFSESSIRRSTRLRNKVKPQVKDIKSIPKKSQPATKVSRSLLQEPFKQVFTSAEPSNSPFETVISAGGELPSVHSTQWQLMYPPGGSSHPSYPWPTADPRLIFHSHHVPLRNGLPDVSYAPDLMLPIGWRQVCWSGLHPVVFDSFHQAFKLTPVGPLPLTCEEVHQGGLQDYVPGGKSHPEFGLLPQASAFSDGSDCEIFNFEEVNWKLPWSHMEGASKSEDNLSSSLLGTDIMLSTALATSIPQPKPHYVECRDCPDNVIDLEDGWRWLKELDLNSTVGFEPASGKTWRGTGILLTTRRTKQPIASLMALTMANKEPGAIHYLGKQDGRVFCAFKSMATPVYVDITLLQDVEFTIMELLCYFPSHYQWRGGADRLARSGMGSSDIANLINMVRRLPPASTCKASTVDGYVGWERQEDGTRVRIEPSDNDGVYYTAERWSNLTWENQDYPLLAIAHGLLELPSGSDAGPITALIEWCRVNNRHQVMLSDVPVLLKEANIEPLIDPGNDENPDKQVLPRHTEAMRMDRKRVIQEKREFDADKEKKSSKRKFE